jgi:hypothetical protein
MKNLLFATLAVTALALTFAAGGKSAPIPESERLAREKLAALKGKLPDLLESFHKRLRVPEQECYTPVPLGPRRLGPAEAKLTVALQHATKAGKRHPKQDHFLTVFLRFHDGAWVTAGMSASWPPVGPGWGEQPTRAAHFFVQDIDAAADEGAK